MRAVTFSGDYVVRATPVNVMLPTGYMVPKVVMQAALDDYTEEYVKQNRALGELSSVDTHMYDHRSVINLSEVSHMMTGYNWWHETSDNSDTLYIHIRPLDTPNGRVLKEYIDNDIPFHASFRAEGSIVSEIAAPNFKLVCFDITPEKEFDKEMES